MRAERRELIACIETDERPWWICADGSSPKGRDRQIVFGTWDSATKLLQRLAPILEKDLPLPAGTPIVYWLVFPDVTDFPELFSFDGPHPEPPTVRVTGTSATIKCPVDYLRGFARADNLADRHLAAASRKGCVCYGKSKCAATR